MTRTMEQTAARERPILFSGEMVRAILAGRKTQTRRVLKTPKWALGDIEFDDDAPNSPYAACRDTSCEADILCPYGKPGDRLWVRESWQAIHVFTDPETGHGDDVKAADEIPDDDCNGYWVAVHAASDEWGNSHRDDRGFGWRPSIHMPRWASRITLEVTGVRVERLHDIGKDGRKAHDVLAEGVNPILIERNREFFHPDDCPALAYAALWESINGKGSWAANPWVWVIEFKQA